MVSGDTLPLIKDLRALYRPFILSHPDVRLVLPVQCGLLFSLDRDQKVKITLNLRGPIFLCF
jgi:hypothetical protein